VTAKPLGFLKWLGGSRASRRTAFALTAVLLSSGCVRTTIRSGRAPGAVAEGWEGRWHHGFAFGLDEAEGPIEPNLVCPSGWSEVDTAIDPLQFVIAVGTLGIYVPTTISVVCAVPLPLTEVHRKKLVTAESIPQ